jgi:hypothetical protein
MRSISRNPLLIFFFILLMPIKLLAQVDEWPGTWRMESSSEKGLSPITIELQIASSERNILFPAQLKLQCDNFSAVYELLLVKKTIREMGISKNKYPLLEKPFSLGNSPSLLNGIFEYSNGVKDVPTLTLTRIQSKQESSALPDTSHLAKPYRKAAARLIQFLRDADIEFRKVNDSPWEDKRADTILSPHLSPAYFGLNDTIHLQEKNGTYNLTGYNNLKKEDYDIVTAVLNGETIINQSEINKKEHGDDIYLDTGLNILAFFADNFGKELPGKGRMNMVFGEKKTALDFASKADSGATFIIAQLYFDHDKSKDKDFENYSGPGTPLQPNDKVLGGLVSTSQQLTFAIWDDAVEDGDSISININGKSFVHGFPVKIKPQFLTVTLKPGPNTITYIADNLGSIPPNTSVLEIIDGNKRRSFTIETTLGENNLINILYDVKTP